MMEGIAASISMAVPRGRRNQTGASSVRYSAMPNETGMAMTRAMTDVSSVPTMGTSAPYSLRTGSQLLVHRNDRPYSEMDSRLPQMRDTMMAPNNRNTKTAKLRVRFLKSASASAFPLRFMIPYSHTAAPSAVLISFFQISRIASATLSGSGT